MARQIRNFVSVLSIILLIAPIQLELVLTRRLRFGIRRRADLKTIRLGRRDAGMVLSFGLHDYGLDQHWRQLPSLHFVGEQYGSD
jgi:hypothetical protein